MMRARSLKRSYGSIPGFGNNQPPSQPWVPLFSLFPANLSEFIAARKSIGGDSALFSSSELTGSNPPAHDRRDEQQRPRPRGRTQLGKSLDHEYTNRGSEKSTCIHHRATPVERRTCSCVTCAAWTLTGCSGLCPSAEPAPSLPRRGACWVDHGGGTFPYRTFSRLREAKYQTN